MRYLARERQRSQMEKLSQMERSSNNEISTGLLFGSDFTMSRSIIDEIRFYRRGCEVWCGRHKIRQCLAHARHAGEQSVFFFFVEAISHVLYVSLLWLWQISRIFENQEMKFIKRKLKRWFNIDWTQSLMWEKMWHSQGFWKLNKNVILKGAWAAAKERLPRDSLVIPEVVRLWVSPFSSVFILTFAIAMFPSAYLTQTQSLRKWLLTGFP